MANFSHFFSPLIITRKVDKECLEDAKVRAATVLLNTSCGNVSTSMLPTHFSSFKHDCYRKA